MLKMKLTEEEKRYIRNKMIRITNFSQNDSIYPTGYALIIDTRINDAFKVIINNMKRIIPENWKVIFMCGTKNKKWVEENFTDINIICLKKETLTVKEYDQMLKTKEFWEQFLSVDKILMFQLDTLVNPNSKHKLEDYLHFDYVGAPWAEHIRNKYPFLPYYGGNGGFSLSSVKMRIDILNKATSMKYSEDIMFSRELVNSNYKVAPSYIAKTFAVETEFYEDPLAIHKPWPYINSSQLKHLENKFPYLKHIKNI